MKILTEAQKTLLAGKCNEARLSGNYRDLFAYVESLLNGEPDQPAKPVKDDEEK